MSTEWEGEIPHKLPERKSASRMTKHEYAYWLADKIWALGCYASEAAHLLRQQADDLSRTAPEAGGMADMLRDALRYRFMRDGDHDGYLCDLVGEELDKEVDGWLDKSTPQKSSP